MDKKAVSALKPKEKLQSSSFRELYLDLVTKQSYRDTTDTLNRVLRREQSKHIKTSSLENRVESFGMLLAEGYEKIADDTLGSYGVDKHTGIISESASIPDNIRNPQLPPVLVEKEVRKLIMNYNRGRDTMTKLKYGITTSCIESSTDHCCYIRIDDVGVKHQKPSRKDTKNEKKGKYVENTVIHIQADGQQYTITAIGMCKAFKLLVAFLLNNKLMEDRRLIFFSDGARNIRDYIDQYFGFRQYTLILDWLHLEKKCREFLSMSIKGTKVEKDRIKQELVNILWTGRHEQAIKYLDNIKNANKKNSKVLKDLKDYITRKSPNITCYALRHELGLSISSNRVEKENDIIVASRQKHNGMSWSAKGSGALSVIKTAMVNGELKSWIQSRSLSFEMVA